MTKYCCLCDAIYVLSYESSIDALCCLYTQRQEPHSRLPKRAIGTWSEVAWHWSYAGTILWPTSKKLVSVTPSVALPKRTLNLLPLAVHPTGVLSMLMSPDNEGTGRTTWNSHVPKTTPSSLKSVLILKVVWPVARWNDRASCCLNNRRIRDRQILIAEQLSIALDRISSSSVGSHG